MRKIPTEDIDSITVVSKKGHGTAAFFLGFLAGSVAGYAIAYSNEKNYCDASDDGVCYAELAGLAGGLGGGFAAGLLGFAIGASTGSAEKFRF